MAFSSFQTYDDSNVAKSDYLEGITYSSNHVRVPPMDDEQHPLFELNNPSARSSNRRPSLEPLEVPIVKKRLHILHVLAAIVSLI